MEKQWKNSDWQAVKQYYKEGKCEQCGLIKSHISKKKSICDNCRIKNKNDEIATKRFLLALVESGFIEEAEEWAKKP